MVIWNCDYVPVVNFCARCGATVSEKRPLANRCPKCDGPIAVENDEDTAGQVGLSSPAMPKAETRN